MFRVRDDRNWLWWNLGGWNNTQHAIEKSEDGRKRILGEPVPARIGARADEHQQHQDGNPRSPHCPPLSERPPSVASRTELTPRDRTDLTCRV